MLAIVASMAARRDKEKESADNHDRRAVELADRDDCDAIHRALRCETWAIRHILNKMRTLSIDVDQYRGEAGKAKMKDAEIESAKRVGSAITQGHFKRQKSIKDTEEAGIAAVLDSAGKPVPKTHQIPSKYWHISDITPTFMAEEILPAIEPGTLSTANIKAKILRRGQAEYAQRICAAPSVAERGALRVQGK